MPAGHQNQWALSILYSLEILRLYPHFGRSILRARRKYTSSLLALLVSDYWKKLCPEINRGLMFIATATISNIRDYLISKEGRIPIAYISIDHELHYCMRSTHIHPLLLGKNGLIPYCSFFFFKNRSPQPLCSLYPMLKSSEIRC